MPCIVKKTLSAILDSGNDYLVTLKQNQPRLCDAMERLFLQQPMCDYYQRCEHRHGRRERRAVAVWDVPADWQLDAGWRGVHRVIRVERWRQVNSPRQYPASAERYHCTYYLTSRRGQSAYELFEMIRAHWHIENRLHWVKDVQYREDRCGIRGGAAAENLSALTSIALTLYRINGYSSIKHATIRFANKIKELLEFFRT